MEMRKDSKFEKSYRPEVALKPSQVKQNNPYNPSFFSEFPFNDANIYLLVFHLDSLGGWMVASQICLNVTA